MISLPSPVIDIDAFISRVVVERQGGVNAALFSGLEQVWKNRCDSYIAVGGDPSQLPTWPQALAAADSFRNLYKSPARQSVQGPILKVLRDRELQFCPICGEAGTPNTLDHYLPQDSYPDFSILPHNLIPTCDICQGHKLDRFIGNNGRLFLHPYFDTWIGGQVARLQITPPYLAPTATLVTFPNLSAEHQALVSSHLAELQVHGRFDTFFKHEYIRLLKLVSRTRLQNKDVEAVLQTIVAHHADRSLNCWEHLMFEGALFDTNLMDYLVNAALPQHL